MELSTAIEMLSLDSVLPKVTNMLFHCQFLYFWNIQSETDQPAVGESVLCHKIIRR